MSDGRRFRISVNPQSGYLSVTQIAGEPLCLDFTEDDHTIVPPSIEVAEREDTERWGIHLDDPEEN